MSGAWVNCDGSHQFPTVYAFPAHAVRWWKELTPEQQKDARMVAQREKFRKSHGKCPVCEKIVALRSDGSVRTHVNSPEAKKLRNIAEQSARDNAVSDLLKLRKELGS